jgi:hypothetical protein
MANDLQSYVPPMVEPGCGGSILNLAPCATPTTVSMPAALMGLGLGLGFYFLNRKNPKYRRPALWPLGVGVLGSAVFFALKVLG